MPLTQNDFDKMDAIATSTVNVGSLTDEQFADMDNIANNVLGNNTNTISPAAPVNIPQPIQQPIQQVNPVAPQQPVYQDDELPDETFGNTLALEGGVSKTSPWQSFRNIVRPGHFLADLGKATANAFRDESILGANAITGAKNWALDRLGIAHKPTEQVKREREEFIPKFDLNPDAKVANFIGEMLGWTPAFAAGGELVGAAGKGVQAARAANTARTLKVDYNAAKEVLNSAQKAKQIKLAKASKPKQVLHDYADTALKAGKDMAAFNAITHGEKTLAGDRQDKNILQDTAEGFAGGLIAGPTLKGGSKIISYPLGKGSEWLARKYPGYANLAGATADILNIDVEKQGPIETWKKINRIISEAKSPASTKFTTEQRQAIRAYERLSEEEKDVIFNELEHGTSSEGFDAEIKDYIKKERKKKKNPTENESKSQEDINNQPEAENAKSANEQVTDKAVEDIVNNQNYENVKVDNEKITGSVKEQPKQSLSEAELAEKELKSNHKYENVDANDEAITGNVKNDRMTMTDIINNMKKSPNTTAPENTTSKSKTKRFKKQLPQKYYTGELKDANAENGRVTEYLEPGKAEGSENSSSFYKRTSGEEDLYDKIIRDYSNERYENLSPEHHEKLVSMLKREGYSYLEDPKTNKYILTKRNKSGYYKEVTPEERRKLAGYFDEYRNNKYDAAGDISPEERIKAERETSIEDNGEYNYYEPSEETLKYQEGIQVDNNEPSSYKFVESVKDDAEFQKFYDEYKNIDDRIKELSRKNKPNKKEIDRLEQRKSELMDEATQNAEKKGQLKTFAENFKKQLDHDADFGRARKVGDEMTDQSDISSFGDLVDSYNKFEFDVKDSADFDVFYNGKHSNNFYKVVDSVQNTMPRKTFKNPFKFMEARMGAKYKHPEEVQKIYDDMINDILSKETTPAVKEELIKRANEYTTKFEEHYLNKYGEGYNLGVKPVKRFEYSAEQAEKDAVRRFIEANEAGDIATAEEIIKQNGFKGKTSKEIYNLKRTHYEQSAEKGYKEAEDLGWYNDKNEFGKYEVTYNPEKAKEWAIKQANIQYKDNPEKLAKELRRLENSETVKARSKKALDDLISRKRNIFKKDIENAHNEMSDNWKENAEYKQEWAEKNRNNKAFNYDENRYVQLNDGSVVRKMSEAEREALEFLEAYDRAGENTYKALRKRLQTEQKAKDKFSIKTAITNFMRREKADLSKIDGKTFDGHEVAEMTEKFRKGTKLGDLFGKIKSKITVKIDTKSKSSKIDIDANGDMHITLGENASEHEFAHAVWREAATKNKVIAKELDKAAQAGHKLYNFITKNSEMLSKIGNITAKINSNRQNPIKPRELAQRLPDAEREVYLDYLKNQYEYRNTMAEQYADCVNEGIFNGTPVEFRKLYSKIKPQFNKLVEDYRYEGTPQEFREFLKKQISEAKAKGNDLVQPKKRARQTSSGRGTTDKPERTEIDLGDRYDKYGNVKGKTLYDLNEADINTPGEQQFKQEHNVTTHVKDLSKMYEEDAIALGILDEQQALNRKYMQDPSGNATYFVQKFKNADKVNPDKIERKEKGGAYHHKTKEGISDRELDLQRHTERVVKMRQTRNLFNYIKNNDIALKIPKDGHIPEGYTPVNSKVLALSFNDEMSREFYEMMTSGDIAIRRAFTDEQAIKDALEFAKRVKATKPDMMIPNGLYRKMFGTRESLKEYYSRYVRTGKNTGVAKTLGYALDFVNDRFKKGVLTSWSFFINNRIGNQIMMAAKDPTEYARGIADALKINRKELPKTNMFNDANKLADMALNGVKHPVQFLKDLVEAYEVSFDKMPADLVDNSIVSAATEMHHGSVKTGFKGFDLWVEQLNGNAIDTSSLKAIKTADLIGLPKEYVKLNGQTVPKGSKLIHTPKSIAVEVGNKVFATPNRIYLKAADKIQNINNFFENLERKQLYSIKARQLYRLKSTAQKMATTEEAIKWLDKNPEYKGSVVKMVQDVLGDYNNYNPLERSILKRVFPFYGWLRTITRNSVHMMQDNPTQFLMMMHLRNRWRDKDKNLAEYQRGNIPTNIKNKRSGKNLIINKWEQAFPWETFGNVRDDSQGGVLGQFSPALKIPAEAAMSRHYFKDSEVTNKRYKRLGTKETGYKYLDLYTGKTLDKLPLSTRAGYVAQEVGLKSIYPMFNSKMLNPRGIPQAIMNIKDNKGFLEPDKLYDVGMGGYYNGDILTNKDGAPLITKKGEFRRRYAANPLDEGAKALNRLGFGLTNPNELSYKEMLEEYEKLPSRRFSKYFDEITDDWLNRAIEYKRKHKRK